MRPARRRTSSATAIVVVALLTALAAAPPAPAADATARRVASRAAPARTGDARTAADPIEPGQRVLMIGMGDSLGHGTLDAANNWLNTRAAYLELVAGSLRQATPTLFRQPVFSFRGDRLSPFALPTNLAVDGADVFSITGLEYGPRSGLPATVPASRYLADRPLPFLFQDKYDRVIYPINLFLGGTASTLDAAEWWLGRRPDVLGVDRAIVVLWIGNNDTSSAALGRGGANPSYEPLPLDVVGPELSPLLLALLELAEEQGLARFDPYTPAAIERHMTTLDDFETQLSAVLDRLLSVPGELPLDVLLVTLPYYSSIGYLFDSDDIEFYLRKLDPDYSVPSTFARVAPDGEPIEDPLAGDRVSLLSFGMMYALMATGTTGEVANRVLEIDGQQRDGLVLSQAEQQTIAARIDGYNDIIRAQAAARDRVHLVDVGGLLNLGLTGQIQIEVDGRVFGRKWVRGNGFSLDGVHPGYTAQGLIANEIIAAIDDLFGLDAPPLDLSALLATDPYIDHDGDGWAPGPDYPTGGAGSLLFLFRDVDDTDADVGVELPDDVWDRISDALLGELL